MNTQRFTNSVGWLVVVVTALASCGPSRVCGAGTVERDGACVPESTTECGQGTVLVDGTCVPESTTECGPGTMLDGGQCVPEPAIECGPGTALDGGQCVPTAQLDCGAGTRQVGNECVPDGTVICGDGTAYDAERGSCEPDPAACGEGTVWIDGRCLARDAALTFDAQEAAEPNADGTAGRVVVPAIGDRASCFTDASSPSCQRAPGRPWPISTAGRWR